MTHFKLLSFRCDHLPMLRKWHIPHGSNPNKYGSLPSLIVNLHNKVVFARSENQNRRTVCLTQTTAELLHETSVCSVCYGTSFSPTAISQSARARRPAVPCQFPGSRCHVQTLSNFRTPTACRGASNTSSTRPY